MTSERFLNTYHNASTAPSPDVPADLASFMLAADPVLAEAATLARILARAHQGAATQLIGEGWAHARKYFSLSENRAPAKGSGIHAYAHEVARPIRLIDEELRSHDEWLNFGEEINKHRPLRGGWPSPDRNGRRDYGFIQASDRLESEFTEQDEANLVRLAALTSTAIDAQSVRHRYRHERPPLRHPALEKSSASPCSPETTTNAKSEGRTAKASRRASTTGYPARRRRSGLDGLWAMYQWLDRAPRGRNETMVRGMGDLHAAVWMRRRDEYDSE
jgi:hypothetical protein